MKLSKEKVGKCVTVVTSLIYIGLLVLKIYDIVNNIDYLLKKENK